MTPGDTDMEIFQSEMPDFPPPESIDLERWDRAMSGEIKCFYDRGQWEQYEEQMMAPQTVVADGCQDWQVILDKFEPTLPKRLVHVYREWLVKHSPHSDEWEYAMFPIQKGECIQEGAQCVAPTGHNWYVLLEENEMKEMGYDPKKTEALKRYCLASTIADIRKTKQIYTGMASTKKQKKMMEKGLRNLPRTLKEAFSGPDAAGWQAAADLEWKTLEEMGVIDHGYTRSELKELGIHKDPINFSVVQDNKYADGIFERHKVRMAVAGHKYNMQKGID